MTKVNEAFKVTNQTTMYEGFFTLKRFDIQHKLWQGQWSKLLTREVLVARDAVVVLPYDPHADMVVLTQQFRMPVACIGQQPFVYACVAGLIEHGQDASQTAYRELQEEAGIEPIAIHRISHYMPLAGASTEMQTLYYAQINIACVEEGIYGLSHESEDIKTHKISFNQALSWIDEGYIIDGSTIFAMHWIALKKAQDKLPFLEH